MLAKDHLERLLVLNARHLEQEAVLGLHVDLFETVALLTHYLLDRVRLPVLEQNAEDGFDKTHLELLKHLDPLLPPSLLSLTSLYFLLWLRLLGQVIGGRASGAVEREFERLEEGEGAPDELPQQLEVVLHNELKNDFEVVDKAVGPQIPRDEELLSLVVGSCLLEALELLVDELLLVLPAAEELAEDEVVEAGNDHAEDGQEDLYRPEQGRGNVYADLLEGDALVLELPGHVVVHVLDHVLLVHLPPLLHLVALVVYFNYVAHALIATQSWALVTLRYASLLNLARDALEVDLLEKVLHPLL
mmetsp:Transcript_16332/g.27623  ORF Transcript_16332/g.27623 Transcript_16332/m.27623 type:complete len:303 (-) Transcript_16332:380-1288(-)